MAGTPGTDQTSPASLRERAYLAEIVTAFSLLGITVLSFLVLYKNGSDGQLVRYVFASIIPLLASWMGTILAFYFSRENFIAATQSVTELTRAVTGPDKLKAIAVKDKMRLLKNIVYDQVPSGSEDKKKLGELLQKFTNVERILILDSQMVVRYLIYKGMVDKYLAKFAQGINLPAGKQASDLTLKDLIESDSGMRTLFEKSFAFVSEDASLADAKREMEKIDKCGDVFVTKTGNRDEALLGWVTDNAIIENSRV